MLWHFEFSDCFSFLNFLSITFSFFDFSARLLTSFHTLHGVQVVNMWIHFFFFRCSLLLELLQNLSTYPLASAELPPKGQEKYIYINLG